MLSEERAQLQDTQEKISQHSFLAAFILWVQETAIQNADILSAAKILLESDFIRATSKNGKVLTIEDASKLDHRTVVDAVRCEHSWPIQLREQVVANYISFLRWLSRETHADINTVEDPDQLLTKGRLLTHSQFITLIVALKDKEQLVAKLLYFGGKRTLDEVLNLQIEAVDFEKNAIRYKSQLIHYPPHVFEDIRALAGKKTHGRLFLGRQNAPLSRLKIFRNFKEIASSVGLGQSFLPTALTSGN